MVDVSSLSGYFRVVKCVEWLSESSPYLQFGTYVIHEEELGGDVYLGAFLLGESRPACVLGDSLKFPFLTRAAKADIQLYDVEFYL